MAEFNPYKLEEAKWTPKNVYEILPPNAVSWSDYDFGQGTDNVDGEAAKKSFIDGFVDFFKDLFGVAGQILGGALELGGAILGGFVEGVISFVGGIANAIGSIFGGGPTESPYPPMFSPIKANLEASMQPFKDQIQDSQSKSEELLAEQVVIRGQIAEQVDITRAAVADAKAASERSGVAIEEAEAAIAAAEDARETLESYNTELNARITTEFNSAVGRANTAVEKADTLAGELSAFQAQHQIEINDAIGKAEQAVADLATLSPQVDEAISKSSAATAKVLELSPMVSQAGEDASAAVAKADQTLSDYTAWAAAQKIRIDSAVSKAEKATSDLATLSPKVTDAVNKASKASSDVSDLTSQVSAAQAKADSAYNEAEKVLSEVTPKIEDAQTKGESALAVADKAVDWLRNPSEIGASLIAIDPETERPNWAENLEPVTTEENPLNLPNAYKTGEASYKNPRSMSVNIDPSTEYVISLWVKADKPGSSMTYDMRDQSSDFPFVKTRDIDGFLPAGGGGRPYWITDVPTEWTQYKKIATARETSRTVRFGISYFKHSGGDTTDVVQYVADFQIYPLVPSQLDVDQAQNDAIRANQDILRQQDEINETQRVANLAQQNFNDNQKKWSDGVDVALVTQQTVNDNFDKWTDGATTAISANTTAIKALSTIDTGESVIAYLTPTDAEVKAGTAEYDVPVWTTATQKKLASNHSVVESLPSRRKGVYGVEAGYGNHRPNTVKVRVRPHTKYLWSFWSYGSGDLVIYMYGDGGYPVKATRQIKVNQAAQEEARAEDGRRVYDSAKNGNSTNSNGTQWLINGFDFGSHGTWKYNMYEVEFTSTTTEVWFDTFYWNWQKASTGGQYLADMQFYPDVPTQAQVDAAQNTALEAHDLLFEKQEDWNEGTTAALIAQKTVDDNFQKWSDGADKAITANTNALAILSSPQGASSIVPINPLTKEPYYLGWAGDRLSVTNIDSVPTRMSVKHTGTAQKRFYASSDELVPVKVARGQVYRWTAWTYSNVADTDILIYFRDPATGTGTASTTHDEESKTHGHTSYGLFLRGIPSGWNKVSGTMTFKDEISSIEMYSVGWNYYGSSSSVTQYITGFDIAPDVPTQESVDAAQNEAISANTEALKALGKKALGASLVPYKTPSTQEVQDYAAGKLNYDPWADPEYFDAGYSVVANTTYGRYTRANSSQRTKSFRGTHVSVDSSIEYRVKFDAYAADAGSILVVAMQDQNGSTAVQSTSVRDQGTMGNTSYPIHYLTLKKGWNSYSGKIKFKSTTTAAAFTTFYWNHSNGVSTLQGLANLEIVPDIPDANVVNLLQDQAILETSEIGKENRNAIDALTEGMDAYVAAADLEALHKDIQDELEIEQDARAALALEINDILAEHIPRTIVYGSGPQFNDHILAERYKLTAKPGWVGQILLDVTYVSKSDGTQTKRVIQNLTVPAPDGSREYSIPNSSFGGYVPAYRVDYWVYRGESIQKALSNSGGYITGSSFTRNSWTRIASHSIKKSNGAVHLLWRTRLTRADRGVTYSFDVRVNGTSVLDKHYKGYGPLTSFGSGGATLSFSGNLSVPDNGTIEIYAKASGTSTQASVSSNKGTLSYLELE